MTKQCIDIPSSVSMVLLCSWFTHTKRHAVTLRQALYVHTER